MKILCTGGLGFIGSEFVNQSYDDIIIVDKGTYAADQTRLTREVDAIYKVDICSNEFLNIVDSYKPDILVNFAAETHVDNSIEDSSAFIQTNIFGVHNILKACLKHKFRFVQMSTDEVYGSSDGEAFREESPIMPNNPYSASKASADMLIRSYVRTHRINAVIIRPCNNYGYGQHPEKFIPKTINNALRGFAVPVYGSGSQVREWIHVWDCAGAIHKILKYGTEMVYNISSGELVQNIDLAQFILNEIGRKDLLKLVEDRKGHDFMYRTNCDKIKGLSWTPTRKMKDELKEIIKKYKNNLS